MSTTFNTMPTCTACGYKLTVPYVLLRREYYKNRGYILCPCKQGYAFSYKKVSPIVDTLVKEAVA